jgi:hypothetical protein
MACLKSAICIYLLPFFVDSIIFYGILKLVKSPSKMSQKKTKPKKYIIILGTVSVFLVAGIFFLDNFSLADLIFSGLGWIGNDLVNGTNTGEPAIGWLSFSSNQTSCTGSAYAVTLGGNQGDNIRPVNGYAWFGIGSNSDPFSTSLSGLTCQNDGESIGWVNFQAGSPPIAVCNSNPSNRCDSAHWYKTGDDFQGDIEGWAKIVSMGDDGWISLKGSTYKLSLQQDGLAESNSYGWNSGIQGTNVSDNSGLGWIKFTNAEVCSITFPSASKTISENTNSLSLSRNRAAGFPVLVNLISSNPSRLPFPPPTDSVTFPAGQVSYSFPISINDVPEDMCTDSATVSEQSVCGQSSVDLTILQSCSTKCSPEEVTIIPGKTATFTAEVQGYSNPSVNWSYSGSDPDCVKSATANGSTYSVEIDETAPGGKDCTMKSFEVTATSSCGSCGSGSCKLLVTRPGWVETNP